MHIETFRVVDLTSGLYTDSDRFNHSCVIYKPQSITALVPFKAMMCGEHVQQGVVLGVTVKDEMGLNNVAACKEDQDPVAEMWSSGRILSEVRGISFRCLRNNLR